MIKVGVGFRQTLSPLFVPSTILFTSPAFRVKAFIFCYESVAEVSQYMYCRRKKRMTGTAMGMERRLCIR